MDTSSVDPVDPPRPTLQEQGDQRGTTETARGARARIHRGLGQEEGAFSDLTTSTRHGVMGWGYLLVMTNIALENGHTHMYIPGTS